MERLPLASWDSLRMTLLIMYVAYCQFGVTALAEGETVLGRLGASLEPGLKSQVVRT